MILRSGLAPAWDPEQTHARVGGCERLDQVVGPIRRSVRDDHDLELVGRIVEGEQVLEAALDHERFIVGGDHERHGRLDVTQTDGSRPKASQPCDRQRVAHMRPAERSDGSPEERSRDHGRIVSPPERR